MAILPIKLVNATFLSRISFVIIMRNMDIRKLFILPSSRNGYIDDVLVHNKTFLQHLVHLKELFKKLHEVNIKIHPKKCEFVVTLVI
jgi:hypothetical protein